MVGGRIVVRTIVSRIEHAAKGEGTVTFMTGELPITKSWSEIHDEARGYAAVLQSRGVRHGDHVGLLGPTTAELVIALQSVWLCGATLVVLPLPMRLASLDEFVSATKARIQGADCVAVLVDPDLTPFVEPSPGDPPVIEFGELRPAADRPTANDFVRPDYHHDDLFILQFTSGSTSEPKGVMLPSHVVAANLDAIAEAAEVDGDTDVMISWLPLYHDMGLVGFCVLPMSAGLNLVLGAPQDFLASPARWMEWISEYKGTATAGPNFSYVLAARALRKSKQTLDLSSMRIFLNGAEPVDPASVALFVEAGERHGLKPGAVFPAFGMAELAIAGAFPKPGSGMVTDTIDLRLLEREQIAVSVSPDHPNARAMVRLGKPVPGLEFRIASPETGATLGPRDVGELQIRGTSVTPGYYKRPDANAELFDGDWLRTGDLAYLVDGNMYMCGRIKDVIIVGGRNVYPQDIERLVGQIDGVRTGNVIAFGVPGRQGKETLAVVAETRTDDLESLTRLIHETTVAAVGMPTKAVVLVRPGTLPKTSSGKLQRSLCRTQYLEGQLAKLEPVGASA